MDGDAELMQPLEAGEVPAYSHIWTGDAPSPPRNPLRPPHTGPDPRLIQPTLQPPRGHPAPAISAVAATASDPVPFKFLGLDLIQLGAIGLACIVLVVMIAAFSSA